jgi:hypothetical protein
MDVRIDIKGIAGVDAMLKAMPKQAGRAAEQALDHTAKAIRDDIKGEIPRVFSSPVPWTRNSLKATLTRGHNMLAKVGFKDPPRMGQHYLVPQVEGGARELKGFERAADNKQYNLAVGAKRTAAGNITVGQAKAVVAGTKRRGGDYVTIKAGNKSRLLPGVYQRIKTTKGFGKAVTRSMNYTAQRGRRRGKFTSAVMARGLKPILILKTNQREPVKPRLDFYGIAHKTFDRMLAARFWSNLNRILAA